MRWLYLIVRYKPLREYILECRRVGNVDELFDFLMQIETENKQVSN